MKTQFKNLTEILDYFKSEETCKKLLELQRWNGKVVCPHCEKNGIISGNPYITNRGFKCSEKTCYKKFTVTVGTILENSKVPLRKWFAAIYLCTAHKKGISSYQLSRDIGVTQKTAWFMLGRIREMMKDKAPELLTGTVEADETYIGGKESNKHKNKRNENPQSSYHKTTVVGVLERNGKLINRVVGGAKLNYVVPVLKDHISKDAILISDQNSVYTTIGRTYQEHHIVNHKQKEFVRGIYHTNTIEGYWSMLKRGIIGIYHQVSPKHLHRYCNEFAYRYNTRKVNDQERFINSFTRLTNGVLTYKQYIAND